MSQSGAANEVVDGGPHEAEFRLLLVAAGKSRTLFDDQLMALAGQKNLDRQDLPEYLLISLSYLASVQHRSALLLLSDATASYGAEIQCRGLLEFLAHIAFVLGKETDTPVGSPRQRAICLSLARAREEFQVIDSAETSGKVPKGRAAGAKERVDIYTKLHDDEGCPWTPEASWPCAIGGRPCRHHSEWPCKHAKARPRTLVRPTIELLADRLKRPWLLDLYVTSSLLAHQALIDRIVHANADGVDLPAPATYRYRALILSAALTAYGQGLGWILETYSPAASNALGEEWDQIYSVPGFDDAINGRWD